MGAMPPDDEWPWEDILTRVRQYAQRLPARGRLPKHLVDDLASEILGRLFSARIARLHPPLSEDGAPPWWWVFMRANSTRIDLLRAQGKDRLVCGLESLGGEESQVDPMQSAAETDPGAAPAERVAYEDLRKAMERCLAALTPRLRQRYEAWHRVKGTQTQAELAAELGVKLNTLKTDLRDANAEIRKCMREFRPSSPQDEPVNEA